MLVYFILTYKTPVSLILQHLLTRKMSSSHARPRWRWYCTRFLRWWRGSGSGSGTGHHHATSFRFIKHLVHSARVRFVSQSSTRAITLVVLPWISCVYEQPRPGAPEFTRGRVFVERWIFAACKDLRSLVDGWPVVVIVLTKHIIRLIPRIGNKYSSVVGIA